MMNNEKGIVTWRGAFTKVVKAVTKELWKQFAALYDEERRIRMELQSAPSDRREEVLERLKLLERRKVDNALKLMESWGIVPLQFASVKTGFVKGNPVIEAALLLEQLDRGYQRIINAMSGAFLRQNIPPEQASLMQIKAAEQVRKVKEALQEAVDELERLRKSVENPSVAVGADEQDV